MAANPQATKTTLTGISALVERALAEAPGGLVSRHGYAVERHGERHLVLLRNGEKLAEAFNPDYPYHAFYGDGSSDTRATNTFLAVVHAGVDVDELRHQAKARQDYFRRINRFRRAGSDDVADRLTLKALTAMAQPVRVADPLDSAELESDDVLDPNAPDPLDDRTSGVSAVWSECRVCGKPLRTAQSRARGIGNECLGKAAA